VGYRRDMALLMAAAFMYSLNFGLLLPVAPLLIVEDAGGAAAGLVNTALLLATVATQWLSPVFLQRMTKGRLYVAGVLLMTLPCLPLAADDASVWTVFAASTLRGAGFGLLTVVSSSLVIELAPVARRGAVFGTFGLATSIPGIFGPSLGLQLLHHYSATEPALVALVSGLIALATVLLVREIRAGGVLHGYESDVPKTAVLNMLGDPDLRAYAISFTLISVAWGGTTSFLALALPADGLASAASFLFISGLLRAAGRWVAGWWVDRGTHAVRAAIPTTVVMAAGLAILAINHSPVAVVVSAVVYGTGLGLIQTLLFLAIVQRNTYGHSSASALWATSLDLGGVLGTSALAAVAWVGGYSAVLWSMPAIMLFAVPLLLRRWRADGSSSSESSEQALSRHPELRADPTGQA
jgi:predicted MFS family arabinose efflux permease